MSTKFPEQQKISPLLVRQMFSGEVWLSVLSSYGNVCSVCAGYRIRSQ
jgi:hypothetical protein